jgi:hypothetical protein
VCELRAREKSAAANVAFDRAPPQRRRLLPERTYLWILEEKPQFRFADEGQGNRFPMRARLGKKSSAPGETPAKHGDLIPGPFGKARGAARIGGELRAEKIGGRYTGNWIMDANSSYTFARKDDMILGHEHLTAAREALGYTGTDISRIKLDFSL